MDIHLKADMQANRPRCQHYLSERLNEIIKICKDKGLSIRHGTVNWHQLWRVTANSGLEKQHKRTVPSVSCVIRGKI